MTSLKFRVLVRVLVIVVMAAAIAQVLLAVFVIHTMAPFFLEIKETETSMDAAVMESLLLLLSSIVSMSVALALFQLDLNLESCS